MMQAMVLEKRGEPLVCKEVEIPVPNENQLLIKVVACGICRTDLHIMDGELPDGKLPLILGHQIVGTIEKMGSQVKQFTLGERVGVPWLGTSCNRCAFCISGRENLCDEARFTGYDIDGGLAEYCVADHRYCFSLPPGYRFSQAAPLFCAGLIGYRALLKLGQASILGIYGFGSAAHIITQLAVKQGRDIYAFTSPGDERAQQFARELGAVWSGDSTQTPPVRLRGAVIFAPAGELVVKALRDVQKGSTVCCAGIHMSDIPSFPYELLWGERTICSVANLTRRDGEAFFAIAPEVPIVTAIQSYSLPEANQALDDLRHGRFSGSAVIII